MVGGVFAVAVVGEVKLYLFAVVGFGSEFEPVARGERFVFVLLSCTVYSRTV